MVAFTDFNIQAGYPRVGKNWMTLQGASEEGVQQRLAMGNGILIGVHDGGVYYSNNGYHWVNSCPPMPCEWDSVTFSDGVFIVQSSTDKDGYIVTEDGVSWKSYTMMDLFKLASGMEKKKRPRSTLYRYLAVIVSFLCGILLYQILHH